MALEGSTLTYFPLPGRGEAARLALSIAGANFKDERIVFAEWSAKKPTTPFGSMPILTLADGTVITQQRAILRYIGRVQGSLYPTDPKEAARVDQVMDVLEDITTTVNNAGRGLEKAEKEAKRAEVVAEGGAGHMLLSKLNAFLALTEGPFINDTPSVGDLQVMILVGTLSSGFYDGVPSDVAASFGSIMALAKAVAKHEGVVKYYEGNENKPGFMSTFE